MNRLWMNAAGLAAALVLAGSGAAPAAPPEVEYLYPFSQAHAAGNTLVRVEFNEPIDPATVDDISFRVYGRWSGPASGTIAVTGARITFTPDAPFFAGEWVTVNVSRAVENLAGENLAKGYAWNFWIRSAPGDLDLVYVDRITCRQGGETWVQVYGAYAGDLDNDGWTDLSAPCEQTSDVRVFMNNAGAYTAFSAKPVPNGAVPSPNEGADFDNDGEIDLVVGNTGNSLVSVMFGDGTGNFPTSTVLTAASSVRGVGVLDLNGDGWDDIVTANRFGNNVAIFLNDGDGTFANAVFKEAGGNNEFSIAVADANHDGLLDVFVGCFNSPYNIVVMLSDGEGDLVAQTPTAGLGQPWQMVVGDFNGDGAVDAAICNTNQNRLAVLLGDGAGGLAAPYVKTVGSFPLAIDTGDIDGDGDLDLVTSNYSGGTWTVYENTGASFANPRYLAASDAGSCAVLHDRDNDGDLDLTGLDENDDWLYLYENQLPPTTVKPAPRAALVSLHNRPNPFNPATEIEFELTRGAHATLTIYDAAGAHVATLHRGPLSAGAHSVRWNGTGANGERMSSGLYFCRLQAGGDVLTRKLVLLK